MKTWKLIGSTNDLKHLGDLIATRWHWSNFSFIQQDEKTWNILQNGEYLQGVRVIKKGSRYRFEFQAERQE